MSNDGLIDRMLAMFNPEPAIPKTPSPKIEPEPWAGDEKRLKALLDEFAALEREVTNAARRTGLDDDGPLTPVLKAFRLCLEAQRDMTWITTQIPRHYVGHIVRTIEAVRQGNQDETARLRAELRFNNGRTIEQIGNQVALAAADAIRRRMPVSDRKLLLMAAAILFSGCIGTFILGREWTSRGILAEDQEIATGLDAALSQDPATRRLVLNLLTWNPIREAVSRCGASNSRQVDGRWTCNVPLWIEAPQPTEPQASEESQVEPLPPGIQPFVPLQTVQVGRDPVSTPADPPRKTRERNKARP